MVIHECFSLQGLLCQATIRVFHGVTVHVSVLKLARFYFLAVLIDHCIQRVIREDIGTFASLLAIAPKAFETFAVWVVEDSWSTALVILEVSVEDLSVFEVVGPSAMLLVGRPFTFVDSAVRPHIVSFTVHHVIPEFALVNF